MNAFRVLTAAVCLLNISAIAQSEGDIIQLQPGAGLHARAQEAMLMARPGTTIVFPEGRHHFDDELIVGKSHITLRGSGMHRTILSFKGQKAGAQGILATGDAFTIEDLAVEDTNGDAIKIEGSNGVVIRRVRVEWTNGPDEKNGAYGLYPVQTRNVLIENCIVRGASDAGVYVGQSRNIVVRHNFVESNVAGIEIENSQQADVYGNVTTKNTAGILVFDLPNLKVKGGKQTRVFHNQVFGNNTKNFAPKGNIVGIVPEGSGIMVMANDDIEVFENEIYDHRTANIGIIDYRMAEIEITDPEYDPQPHRIHIHHNVMTKKKWTFFSGNRVNFLVHLLFGFRIPDVIYDGIEDGSYSGTPFPDDRKICIHDNANREGKPSTFGNMHLDHQRTLSPFPGGPVTRDLTPHDCEHEPLAAVALESFPPVPLEPDNPYSDEQIAALCGAEGQGVNWAASVVNCPRLNDYRLGDGIRYELSTPLFTDYAWKDRVIYLPDGTSMEYRKERTLKFPVGAIIAKTFSYPHDFNRPDGPRRVIETRLLIHREDGWHGLPYIWNEDGTEATLARGGGVRDVSWIAENGKRRSVHYRVPSMNKCTSCHGGAEGDMPIGPKARFLNFKGQLASWAQAGHLEGLPADDVPKLPVWNDPKSGSLELRTRAYLEINCAHCHNPAGRARFSGLFLESDRDPLSTVYGYCKPPVAAGGGAGKLHYDVVPGKAKKSIMWFRMNHNDSMIRMPELGREMVHDEGVALVRSWIDSLPRAKCNAD